MSAPKERVQPRRPAGIRTFALGALLGAIATHLGGVPLLAVATTALMVLTALSYIRGHDEDPGLTTEIGLITTPLLGGVAMSDTLLASGLGAALAVVFAAKTPMHGFVRRTLTTAEVTDGLVFAVATLLIWPQLPDRYLGPLQSLNPHSIWLLVILVLALGPSGHIATRVLGARFGLPIAGLASGFVSSTATIGAMAGRAAKDPASMSAAVAAAAFSTVATVIQLALLLLTITRSTFVLMAPALAAGATAAAIYGIAFALRGVAPDGAQQSNRDGLSASEPPSASLHDGRHAGRRCDLEGLAWRRRSRNWDGRRWICRHAFRGDFGRLAGSVCG